MTSPGELRFRAFVWWAIHDAVEGRNADAIDAVLLTHAGAAVGPYPREFRELAAYHVLHASCLEHARAQVEAWIANDQDVGVDDIDSLTEEALAQRMPPADLSLLAQEIAKARAPAIKKLAITPGISFEIAAAADYLAEAVSRPARARRGRLHGAMAGTGTIDSRQLPQVSRLW